MGAESAAAGGSRIEAARAALRERLAEGTADEAVRIVGAGATPTVLYEGDAAGAGGAIEALRAGPGAANLPAALRLAAGLRAGDGSEVVLLRAPEEAAPRVRRGAAYEDVAVGKEAADVGLGGASAHCDVLGAEACEVFVRITNRGAARGCRCGSRSAANRPTASASRCRRTDRRRSSSPPHPGPRSRSACCPAMASPPTTRPSSRSPNRAASGSP